MLKVINMFLIVAVLAGAFVVYSLEYSIQKSDREITRINHEIAKTQETIALLDAEWSKLTRPERLQRLAKQHLGLEPLRADQVVDGRQLAGVLPEHPALDPSQTKNDPLAAMLKGLQQ